MVSDFMAEKFTQCTGIHAEAYPSGEFRHGPLSMIDESEKTPVIFMVFNDSFLANLDSNIQQVKARGATVLVLTDCKDKLPLNMVDSVIELPPNGHFNALVALVALQYLCLYTAEEKGIDIDQQIFDAIDFLEQ